MTMDYIKVIAIDNYMNEKTIKLSFPATKNDRFVYK